MRAKKGEWIDREARAGTFLPRGCLQGRGRLAKVGKRKKRRVTHRLPRLISPRKIRRVASAGAADRRSPGAKTLSTKYFAEDEEIPYPPMARPRNDKGGGI